MREDISPRTLDRGSIAHVLLATAVALLLLVIVGSLLGMLVWPALHMVYERANRALAVVTVAVDCTAGVISFWLFGKLSQAGSATSSPRFVRNLIVRNRPVFATARFASLVLVLEFVLQLLAVEFRVFVVEHVGTFTDLNPQSASWVLLAGVALPVVLLFFLLLLGARWNARTPAAGV